MPDDNPDPQDAEYGLVMPFVVCASNGGPYDDDSFVAGYQAGQLDSELGAAGWARVERGFPIPSALVPQVDLIAMKHGYAVEATPWGDDPAAWTFVAFVATAGEPT